MQCRSMRTIKVNIHRNHERSWALRYICSCNCNGICSESPHTEIATRIRANTEHDESGKRQRGGRAGTPLRARTMRGPKLNWAAAPFARKGLVEFYSPWKEREGAHSTRLRNHKSKWYRFETARGCLGVAPNERKGEEERVRATKGGCRGGLLRAVRSINGGRFGPCRTTGHRG